MNRPVRNIPFAILTAFLLLSPSQAFASSLSATNYTYDKLGNIQTMNNTVDTTKSVSYSYDDIYRLERVSGGYSAGYGYDADGNILTKNEDQNLTLTYIPSDSVASHGPKSVNGRLLKYDGNGNLVEDSFSNLKIVYDYDNRPVEIRKLDSNTLLAKYSYDGEGKRVKKEIYENETLKATTYYVNQYYEKEISAGGNPKVRKFYGSVAYREGDTLTYQTADHLSSTTLTTNSQGQKINEFKYYPYGSPITNNQQPTTPPPNSWIGQKHDDESGLYFLNARYYSPTYGRFVSSDGVEDPTARGNRFIYAANSPVTLKDANGNCPICIIPLILGGMIVGGSTYGYGIAPNETYQKTWNSVAGYQGDFQTAQEAGIGVANAGAVAGMLFEGGYGVSGLFRNFSVSSSKSGSWQPIGQGGLGRTFQHSMSGRVYKMIRGASDKGSIETQQRVLNFESGVLQKAESVGSDLFPPVLRIDKEGYLMGGIPNQGTLADFLKKGGTVSNEHKLDFLYRVNQYHKETGWMVGDLIRLKNGPNDSIVRALKGSNILVGTEGRLYAIDPMSPHSDFPVGPYWIPLNDRWGSISSPDQEFSFLYHMLGIR